MDTVKVRCAVPCFLNDIDLSERYSLNISSNAGITKWRLRHLRHRTVFLNYYIKKENNRVEFSSWKTLPPFHLLCYRWISMASGYSIWLCFNPISLPLDLHHSKRKKQSWSVCYPWFWRCIAKFLTQQLYIYKCVCVCVCLWAEVPRALSNASYSVLFCAAFRIPDSIRQL